MSGERPHASICFFAPGIRLQNICPVVIEGFPLKPPPLPHLHPKENPQAPPPNPTHQPPPPTRHPPPTHPPPNQPRASAASQLTTPRSSWQPLTSSMPSRSTRPPGFDAAGFGFGFGFGRFPKAEICFSLFSPGDLFGPQKIASGTFWTWRHKKIELLVGFFVPGWRRKARKTWGNQKAEILEFDRKVRGAQGTLCAGGSG